MRHKRTRAVSSETGEGKLQQWLLWHFPYAHLSQPIAESLQSKTHQHQHSFSLTIPISPFSLSLPTTTPALLLLHTHSISSPNPQNQKQPCSIPRPNPPKSILHSLKLLKSSKPPQNNKYPSVSKCSLWSWWVMAKLQCSMLSFGDFEVTHLIVLFIFCFWSNFFAYPEDVLYCFTYILV